MKTLALLLSLASAALFAGHALVTTAQAHTGSLDASFDPGTGAGAQEEFDKDVLALALQPDGRLLVGGKFSLFNGMSRGRIARLASDGTVDASFDPGTGADNPEDPQSVRIQAVLPLPDGKILVGGSFASFGGAARTNLARLNANGSVDASFDLGANSLVTAFARQPDGGILVAGQFTTLGGATALRLARLTAAGTIDPAFNASVNNTVDAVALAPAGQVLITGRFTNVAGMDRQRVARLNADGSLDASFADAGVTNTVSALAVQPDGRVLIGGSFTTVAGVPRNRIARLKTDGTADETFDPGTGASGQVTAIALQPDGKVVVGGRFILINEVERPFLARLNRDGSVDATFHPGIGPDDAVLALALQDDGRIVAGGQFSAVTEVSRNGVARFHTDPRLLNPVRGAGMFSAAVQTARGWTYTLQYRDSIPGTVWMPASVLAGDDTIRTLTDSSATATNRFYRVRVE